MDKTIEVYVEIVNDIEDLFEYKYKNMTTEEIRAFVFKTIDEGIDKLK